ncbi:DNA-3-methyladenine glycosylase [Candidatus Parcubacteria bacterium]|nr:MAG: DNA-3-methyladenine glycosylase [Candidatus Parcubacteria bacterium]
MRRLLGPKFFDRPTLVVAKDLLGKYLVRKRGRREIAAMITEVEAYVGPHDLASHASRGKTIRNSIMFGPPGYWYVYFTYGMHWMLNVVTEREAYPAAILMRGIEGVIGPARVTKALGIDGRLNRMPAMYKTGLWIEDRGAKIPPRAIRRSPRIGVDYAGAWRAKPWRFSISLGK